MKRLVNGAISLTILALFIVGAVEVGLRVLNLYEPPAEFRTARPDLYIEDERVGYHLWPSTSTFDRYPATTAKITALVSHSAGFRDAREYGSAGDENKRDIWRRWSWRARPENIRPHSRDH